MSTTNHTTNYELSQYIGTDVTSYLSNYNSDMYKIDAQMKVNADNAAEAKSDAATAVATSTTAASNASAAVSKANAANTTAEAAQTASTAAQTAAGAAQTTAKAALAASASNTIGNLAPAYDPNLTYAVGDLVTYVDPETNQGKLYKNIVPIDTPEAFNINKWDDVTTSEVYIKRGYIIDSHLTVNDATKTWNEVLTALRNGISTLLPDTKYEFMIHTENATVYKVMRVNYHTQLEYVTVSTNAAFNVEIERLDVKTEDSGGQRIIIQPDGTITTTSLGSVAVGQYNLGEYFIMHLDIDTPTV